jgi:hypothetical protein
MNWQQIIHILLMLNKLNLFFIMALAAVSTTATTTVFASSSSDQAQDSASKGLNNADDRIHDSPASSQDSTFHEGLSEHAGFSCQSFFGNPPDACGGIE